MKNKTFAQRALDIQKKYSRAKFDPTEKQEMENELDALIEEQEAYKAAHGYGESNPGVQKFDGTGPSYLPYDRLSFARNFMSYDNPLLNVANNFNSSTKTTLPGNSVPIGGITPISTVGSAKQGLVVTPTMQKNIKASKERGIAQNNPEDKTSVLPTVVGAGTGLFGNLLLANKAKGLYNPISAPSVAANTINLEPQAESLRSNATTSKRANLLTARNLGTNAGEALANVSAANAGVDRGLGDALTKLYLGQEQFNATAKNEASMFNAGNTLKANMYNSQNKSAADSESLDYLSGAMQTIPAAMREVQLMKADEKNKRLLENYYKTIGGQHYQMLNSLYGVDPFKYQVK